MRTILIKIPILMVILYIAGCANQSPAINSKDKWIFAHMATHAQISNNTTLVMPLTQDIIATTLKIHWFSQLFLWFIDRRFFITTSSYRESSVLGVITIWRPANRRDWSPRHSQAATVMPDCNPGMSQTTGTHSEHFWPPAASNSAPAASQVATTCIRHCLGVGKLSTTSGDSPFKI